MLTNLKLCGGAALSLILSALVISPVFANPMTEVTPENSSQRNQLSEDESIYRIVYPVGIVRTIEGNMVTVQSSNGQMVVYEVSPVDMETWKLYTGSYVLVDEENNKIKDTVYKGQIRSIVGSVVTVELPDGTLEKYGADRRVLGSMNLIEGQKLYVTRSQILALAPQVDTNPEAYLMNVTPQTQIYQESQSQQTQMPTQPLIENNQSQMNQQEDMNQAQQPQETYQPTQQTQYEEPVRGMW